MPGRRRVSLKAVAIGWLVQWFSTAIGAGMVGATAAGLIFLATGSHEHIAQQIGGSVGIKAISLVAASVSSLLAGYLAARIARHSELTHALLTGLLSVLTWLRHSANHFESAPVWHHVVFLSVIIPFALLGGYLRSRGGMASATESESSDEEGLAS